MLYILYHDAKFAVPVRQFAEAALNQDLKQRCSFRTACPQEKLSFRGLPRSKHGAFSENQALFQ